MFIHYYIRTERIQRQTGLYVNLSHITSIPGGEGGQDLEQPLHQRTSARQVADLVFSRKFLPQGFKLGKILEGFRSADHPSEMLSRIASVGACSGLSLFLWPFIRVLPGHQSISKP
jgi:hypothetical protein